MTEPKTPEFIEDTITEVIESVSYPLLIAAVIIGAAIGAGVLYWYATTIQPETAP